jgi:hypothetical protein
VLLLRVEGEQAPRSVESTLHSEPFRFAGDGVGRCKSRLIPRNCHTGMKPAYALLRIGVHRHMKRIPGIGVLALAALMSGGKADAHYCSNIFVAHARMVVKPETTTVNLSGSSTQLKVYLQNNWPYKVQVEMRGNASSYNISVSPSSQDVYPGQQVLYTLTISGGSGSVPVSQLSIQVQIRQGGWQGESDDFVDPNPSQSSLVSATTGQSASLNAATLADKYPSAQIPSMLGRTGIEQASIKKIRTDTPGFEGKFAKPQYLSGEGKFDKGFLVVAHGSVLRVVSEACMIHTF